jgi:hypothetical protein
MRQRWTFAFVAAAALAVPLGAQTPAPVAMPSGDYVIQARDTAKAGEVGIAGWAFVLKGNGAFTITNPEALTFTGKLVQKDGVATYTDQSCETPATYSVSKERGGFAFDFKGGGCPENEATLGKLLFVPGKPKK